MRSPRSAHPKDAAGVLDGAVSALDQDVVQREVADLLGRHVRQGVLTVNPAAALGKLKGASETKRRPFTLAEIKRLLETAGKSEWRGL